jgi:prepilin-type N-terminal cleavage/methylation domain-containing protein
VFKLYRDLLERRKAGESSESGFTLIELLIVIVVLGILAAIVIFSLTGVTGQSQQAACNSDAKSVQTAVAAYEANPPSGIAAGTAPTSITAVSPAPNTGLVPNYLHSAPTATVNSNGYLITLDATTAGQVDVTTKSVAATSYDSATNPCNVA